MTSASSPAVPHVYVAVSEVMEEIGKTGISKDRNNKDQNYKFRGIDDVYNALNGIMAKHRLLLLPTGMTPSYSERPTKSGGSVTYTKVIVDWKLVSAVDGSSEMIQTLGEAMDSADKSSNKSQSAAMKYATLMVFMIPTEGDNDADATTHEVAPRQHVEPPVQTLTQRADAFEAKLRASKTREALEGTFKRGSGLMADLDAKDPERFEALRALHANLDASLAHPIKEAAE